MIIPPIGRILGQPIGYATEEDFERKLGPPTRSMGGHSNGRCTWWDPVNKIAISMDGFEYARGGMLVDDIEIEAGAGADRSLKRVKRKLKLSDYKVCGGALSFGMKREKVLAIIKKKSWKYVEFKESIKLTAPGIVDFRGVSSNVYHVAYHWETQLGFSNGELWGVYLTVDYKVSP